MPDTPPTSAASRELAQTFTSDKGSANPSPSAACPVAGCTTFPCEHVERVEYRSLPPSEPCLRCQRCAGCHAPDGDCPVPNSSCVTGRCPQGPTTTAAPTPLDQSSPAHRYMLDGKGNLRESAYYYSFDLTGVEVIDRILAAVAGAGKAYHHTESWQDPIYGNKDGPTMVDVIQQMANEAAAAFREATNGA